MGAGGPLGLRVGQRSALWAASALGSLLGGGEAWTPRRTVSPVRPLGDALHSLPPLS